MLYGALTQATNFGKLFPQFQLYGSSKIILPWFKIFNKPIKFCSVFVSNQHLYFTNIRHINIFMKHIPNFFFEHFPTKSLTSCFQITLNFSQAQQTSDRIRILLRKLQNNLSVGVGHPVKRNEVVENWTWSYFRDSQTHIKTLINLYQTFPKVGGWIFLEQKGWLKTSLCWKPLKIIKNARTRFSIKWPSPV